MLELRAVERRLNFEGGEDDLPRVNEQESSPLMIEHNGLDPQVEVLNGQGGNLHRFETCHGGELIPVVKTVASWPVDD